MKYWRTILCALMLAAGGLGVWAADSWKSRVSIQRDATSDSAIAASVRATPRELSTAPATTSETLKGIAPPMLPEPIRQSGTEVSPRAPPELTSSPGTDDAVKPTNAVEQEILKYYQAQFRRNEPPSLLNDSESKPTLPSAAATKQAMANPLQSVSNVGAPTPPAPATELTQAPPMTTTPEPALASVPTRGVTNEPLSLPTRTPAQNKPAMKPLQVQIRTGPGEPTIEIRDGDTLLLKFTCTELAMQVQGAGLPLPELTGQGKVRVHGCGIDGVCDQLVLSPDSGDVSLRGNVRLTCFRGDSSAEVTAEMLKFQLRAGAAGVKSAASTVVPAGTKMPYAE